MYYVSSTEVKLFWKGPTVGWGTGCIVIIKLKLLYYIYVIIIITDSYQFNSDQELSFFFFPGKDLQVFCLLPIILQVQHSECK